MLLNQSRGPHLPVILFLVIICSLLLPEVYLSQVPNMDEVTEKTAGGGKNTTQQLAQHASDMLRMMKVAVGQLDMMEMLETVAEMTDAVTAPSDDGQETTNVSADSDGYISMGLSQYRVKFNAWFQKYFLKDAYEKNSLESKLHRNFKFNKPPENIIETLALDDVDDVWEALEEGRTPDLIPIIGILTQPTSQSKKKAFNYTDYILEVNNNFVKWPGSKTIAIPYDISEVDLKFVLDQINGVLLTGGALTLVDEHGRLHPYYRTAKRIIDYSKMKKDQFGEEWPVLGICQGLEVISVYMAHDDRKALDLIDIYGQNRAINWTHSESRFFQDFPDDLKDRMEEEGLALHAHTYSTSLETYRRIPGLHNEMIVTQTDIWHDAKNQSGSKVADIEFINAMEHKKYPIFASMYHPEYQLLVFTGDKKWAIIDNEITDEIAFMFSLKLNRYARLNSNRVRKGNEYLFDTELALSRNEAVPYPMIENIEVYAYGYNGHPVIDSHKKSSL